MNGIIVAVILSILWAVIGCTLDILDVIEERAYWALYGAIFGILIGISLMS